jgi:HEAT repeat protein
MQERTLPRSSLAADTKKPAKKKPAAKKPAPYMTQYKGAPDAAALDKAFENLKTFNWGPDIPKFHELLGAIEDAVPASHGDVEVRKDLETRLVAVLGTSASRAAKDYVCRKLTVIGTAASVPTLAAMLPDKDLSHMARYALERIPAGEAAKALRDGLAKTDGAQKAGVAGSLGVRRDVESISALAALLGDSDAQVALAAATALGDIGTGEAVNALQAAAPAAAYIKPRIADAQLTAAEKFLAASDPDAAMAVYKSLLTSPIKSVKLAATRGMLMASKK